MFQELETWQRFWGPRPSKERVVHAGAEWSWTLKVDTHNNPVKQHGYRQSRSQQSRC